MKPAILAGMTYRPYPNVDRARRQVERHTCEGPPLAAVRPPTPLQQRLSEAFAPLAAFRVKAAQPSGAAFGRSLSEAFAAPPVDEYRLSSAPRVVGGPS